MSFLEDGGTRIYKGASALIMFKLSNELMNTGMSEGVNKLMNN